MGFAEFGLMTYEIVPLAVSWAQHVCDSCCICVLFCHVASLMGCAVCVSSSSLCTPSTASQGSACLWKKKAVNGDNYSKQNAVPTTHNYATDANYCVSY